MFSHVYLPNINQYQYWTHIIIYHSTQLKKHSSIRGWSTRPDVMQIIPNILFIVRNHMFISNKHCTSPYPKVSSLYLSREVRGKCHPPWSSLKHSRLENRCRLHTICTWKIQRSLLVNLITNWTQSHLNFILSYLICYRAMTTVLMKNKKCTYYWIFYLE